MTVVNLEPRDVGHSEVSTNAEDGVNVHGIFSNLEGLFKGVVTRYFDEILQKRPTEPIRVLAERLLEESDNHDIERLQCALGNGIECTLTRACTRKGGAELYQVPGLPLLQLVTPTSFELDAALRHLDALTPQNSQIIVFIEAPSPPTDLFFLKGVPYITNITEQLLKQRRRGAEDDVVTDGGPDALSDRVSSLLQSALHISVKRLREEVAEVVKSSSRFRVVELPEIQCNFFKLFDVIDRAFGGKIHFWDAHTVAENGIPSAVLASFNPRFSNMTLSRIVATMLPLYEQVQRRKIASTLDSNKARIRQFDYRYITKYWEEVMQRRDERDRARGQFRPMQTSVKPRSRKTSPVKQKSLVEKNIDPLFAARVQRRENEDNLFLKVLQHLWSQAATRIQSVFRGYRWRKRSKMSRPKSKSAVNVACWVEELPKSLPVLLRRCVERLSAVHGELFGNYVASCPPLPRSVTILKPLRTVLKAEDGSNDDVDSETESWEMEMVIIPLKRQTKPPPHFNLLRRLMECEFLSKCNTIDQAMSFQKDCSGLSVLQRRAYDCYRSLVLNLLHIAFLELYHRERLPTTVVTFGEYMQCFHRDVFAWLSAPHLFSLIALQDPVKNDCVPPLLCHREIMETERVLLARAYKEGSLYVCSSWKHAKQQLLIEEKLQEDQDKSLEINNLPHFDVTLTVPSSDMWECEGVYASPAFLSETAWEIALQEIISHFHGEKVAWWSLHPNPTVYMDGEPLVLVARHELQEVDGRPRFDEYVLSIEETRKIGETLRHNSDGSFRNPPDTDSHLRSFTEANDCPVLDKKGDARIVSEDLVETKINSEHIDILTDEMCLSTFGVSLRSEDSHLARLLHEDAMTPDLSRIQLYSTVNMLSLYGVPVTHATLQPLVMLSSSENQMSWHPTSRDAPSVFNVSVSENPSGYRSCIRLRNYESWSKTIESPRVDSNFPEDNYMLYAVSKETPPAETSLMSAENALQEVSNECVQSSMSPIAESVDTVAHRVAKRVLGEGDFVHLRPWIIPVCGRAWVNIFEQFTSKCLIQLREGYSIVLAVGDPCQVMLFNAVCLLRHAMKTRMEKHECAESLPGFRLGPRRSRLAPSPPLLSMEATSSLSFMDSFYDCVEKLVNKEDMSVLNSVYIVQKVMQGNSPGGLVFLEELSTLIHSAERETDPHLLVDFILTIVQRVELYCWLILFQMYLSLPATTGSFDEGSDVQLSSFSAFVNDVAVRTWIDHIDPWSSTPWRSPDPFHLRYSNGHRRWDDRNYIFRVAF